MTFERLHKFRLERIAAAGGTKRSIACCTAGAAGNLRKFGGIELPELVAVEFSIGSKGDVVDIEIEPHPDGIGRDQIVDIARLVQGNLRIACPR